METGPSERFADRAAQAAHETIETLHARAAAFEDQVRATAGSAADQAMAGGQRVEGTLQALLDLVRQNPLTATALGVAVGFALSAVLRSGTAPAAAPGGVDRAAGG
jgi:ElaB/YqjD/DUF883 family membrane-anchored ribosome-binding protein